MAAGASGRPIVWAHRGASLEAPENTLAAFERAARLGAHGIELDVQRCASGEVVVFHDRSLARTTGFVGLIEETPWSVLRALDAGARFSPRFAGERVPLLAEVLAQTPPSLLVNVELKCARLDDRGLTAETLRVIAEARAGERAVLSSFNTLCMLRARSLEPRVARALLFDENSSWPARGAWLGPVLGARALHPHFPLCSERALRRWRFLGYSATAWTVDDPDEARRLARAGCEGIMTNAPELMLRALGWSLIPQPQAAAR